MIIWNDKITLDLANKGEINKDAIEKGALCAMKSMLKYVNAKGRLR